MRLLSHDLAIAFELLDMELHRTDNHTSIAEHDSREPRYARRLPQGKSWTFTTIRPLVRIPPGPPNSA